MKTIRLFLVLSLATCGVARAGDDPHAAHRAAMRSQVASGETRVTLPDVVLRDADGEPFRLRPQSFAGKIVVVDFIFTTCSTICPALSSVMASVQRGLGARMGDDIVLLSISVDPVNDTPQVMRAYAQRVGAGEHWRWLTGTTGDIARVLRAFGLSPGRPNDHPPLILVGDPVGNRWLRWVGVPTPTAIVDAAHAMAPGPDATASTLDLPAAVPAPAKDPHARHRTHD